MLMTWLLIAGIVVASSNFESITVVDLEVNIADYGYGSGN